MLRQFFLDKALPLLGRTSFGLIFIGLIGMFYIYSQLPKVEHLKDIHLQVPLKIYSADHKLIAVYGDKRRNPVKLEDTPPLLVKAIIATEDHRFYQHHGVDFRGLMRATAQLILKGYKAQGGSTITMQVARNFFLSRKKTYSRKINEILLAFKIENELSKEDILELYINKIFLGKRAYGFGAAAEVYYGCSLSDLSLAQLAMLAGIPQAPTAVNPINAPKASIKRRQHVLSRMLAYGYIDQLDYDAANAMPITAHYHRKSVALKAPYIAETVRNELYELYGEQVYTAGYEVYTTIDSSAQNAANQATRRALLQYDQRHGYRGPIGRLGESRDTWLETLKKLPTINGLIPAAVLRVEERSAELLSSTQEHIHLPLSSMEWARRQQGSRLGPKPQTAHDILTVGDMVYLDRQKSHWSLAQPPEVQGALVAMSPQTGAILSLTGGFDYHSSRFNRATQALRQPGSNLKPFIYSKALEQGYTLASMINDAPITENTEYEQWRPTNYTKKFYGPTRLKIGLTKSRNLISIRLLKALGIEETIDFLTGFGFAAERIPKGLSLALGTAHFTPLEMATGYCVFANGGSKVTPYLIDRIKDYTGQTVFQAFPPKVCHTEPCHTDSPYQPIADRVLSPQTAYLITSALQDAIRNGSGRRALKLGRHDLSGKTGTTNAYMDAWYSGYNSNLVVTTWVGFDTPKTLHEYAVRAALPMWIYYMEQALAEQPEAPLTQPKGIVTIKINPKTGQLAGKSNGIYEVFREQHVPRKTASSDTLNAGIEHINQLEELF